ncbi:hypothetical protein VA596_41455 [Amycolatopsis sp., V23-08]|uniref:Uncharacterized protein n=1 Tax=Amycolatopsis heterodermiae TaxID=3110235 RepID=A0ABU5RKG2_9PSEU|nr:hypothetical protein [Amycolatopsis sp., V23-08]MEA5366054.1 hypothetical protein [Amycolatopsis sp., V23-08]
MTATVSAPTLDSVLKRADGQYAKRAGDDPAPPEYLAALATALHPLLEQTSAPGPGVDLAELARLRSESDARGRIIAQRDATIEGLTERLAKARQAGTAGVERTNRERESLTREVAELKQKLDAAEEDTRCRIDAAVRAITAASAGSGEETDRLREALVLRTAELDEARAERDTARAQLRDRPAPGTVREKLVSAAADVTVREKLDAAADQVAQLTEQLAAANRDLALANRTLDEIADEQLNHQAGPHRHQFELDLATGKHDDCECGQPWIRDLVEDDEPVEPDIEPLDQLFARIRDELGEVAP